MLDHSLTYTRKQPRKPRLSLIDYYITLTPKSMKKDLLRYAWYLRYLGAGRTYCREPTLFCQYKFNLKRGTKIKDFKRDLACKILTPINCKIILDLNRGSAKSQSYDKIYSQVWYPC